MLSTVATLALSFGLAQSAAVSLYPKSAIVANSTSAASTCNTDYPTITTTATESGTGTVYEWITATAEPSTTTVTSLSYIDTVSSSAGSISTFEVISYTGASTITDYVDYVTVGSCSATATVLAESTSTVYTGSYMPTVLTTLCPTRTAYETVYLDGEITSTGTRTDTPVVTGTSYSSRTSTDYYYDTTTTVTSLDYSFVYETATSTETYATECTSTSYTATATGVSPTQSAKCAPTNLVSGLVQVGPGSDLNVESFWRTENPANRDASSCCQACVEDENCVAMDYLEGEGYGCELYHNTGSECEGSIQVKYGVGNFVAQAGCGAVLLAPRLG